MKAAPLTLSLFAALAIGLSLPSASASEGHKQAAKTQKIPRLSQQEALLQWAKVYEVFSHPRCANCHVGEDHRPRWSGPHYRYSFAPDESWSVHGMNIVAGPAQKAGGVRDGSQTLPCVTCHMKENSPLHHGPPGAEVWALAPVQMQWWQKSSSEICAQIKDPARNGGRSLEAIAAHVEHDSLVHWGWSPGLGRNPAPYSAQETATAIRTWAANGAPCP